MTDQDVKELDQLMPIVFAIAILSQERKSLLEESFQKYCAVKQTHKADQAP